MASSCLCVDVDPPARVGRVSYLNGTVSFQQAGTEEWNPASLNYPVTTGDHLWADDQSRAEVHIGSTAIRLSSRTAFSFLNLDDRMVQMRLSEGALSITVRNLPPDEALEVDTPNAAITLLRSGEYRIDADPDSRRTRVTVRTGEAEVTAGGAAFPVRSRQTGEVTGEDQVSSNVVATPPPDSFDRWSDERNDRESHRPPPRYVSREMVGYEDLDTYGAWQTNPEYGAVWVPRVASGWAPYRYGRWVWISPWGWTWVDEAPWGFAPFHYGRWAYMTGTWCWVPGAVAVRPVYSPALVAFVGGNRWSASMSFGGGGGVAWFPLGPREVYRPAYAVSPVYVTRINESHVTNVTNITNINVTNVHYVNQTVPNAVTAVSHENFSSARPISHVAVAVPAQAMASAQVVQAAPAYSRPVAAVAPVGVRPVAQPSAAAISRPVVTRTPPPVAPVQVQSAAPRIQPVAPVQIQPAAPRVQSTAPVQVQPAAPTIRPQASPYPVTSTAPTRPATPAAQTPAAPAVKPIAPVRTEQRVERPQPQQQVERQPQREEKRPQHEDRRAKPEAEKKRSAEHER